MMGHIAIILGMGAILGQLLSSSGSATALGSLLVRRCGQAGMPWALLCLGILVGMPVFFEVGLVLLMPVIVDAAQRSGRSPRMPRSARWLVWTGCATPRARDRPPRSVWRCS